MHFKRPSFLFFNAQSQQHKNDNLQHCIYRSSQSSRQVGRAVQYKKNNEDRFKDIMQNQMI